MADLEEQQIQYDLEAERIPYQRAQEEQAAQEELAKAGQMGLGIFLIALFLSLVADFAEIITLGTIGLVVVFFIDLILGAMLGFSSGARKQWKKWIAGFLPIPLVRVALLIWSYTASRSGIVQRVSSLA